MDWEVIDFHSQAQIREQMSTGADILDEERKRAEASLEGLKSKLKNLEEVFWMILVKSWEVSLLARLLFFYPV